jgi:low affinity Fe/Cu permease
MIELIRLWITQLGVFSAHPAAFAIVAAYGVSWFLFERETFNWHAVATMATWFMTLFIQRAEHRDTQAIHAKLDELLHTQRGARNELTRLDDKEPEDIARFRDAERAED